MSELVYPKVLLPRGFFKYVPSITWGTFLIDDNIINSDLYDLLVAPYNFAAWRRSEVWCEKD